jgi:hypothetical protein
MAESFSSPQRLRVMAAEKPIQGHAIEVTPYVNVV